MYFTWKDIASYQFTETWEQIFGEWPTKTSTILRGSDCRTPVGVTAQECNIPPPLCTPVYGNEYGVCVQLCPTLTLSGFKVSVFAFNVHTSCLHILCVPLSSLVMYGCVMSFYCESIQVAKCQNGCKFRPRGGLAIVDPSRVIEFCPLRSAVSTVIDSTQRKEPRLGFQLKPSPESPVDLSCSILGKHDADVVTCLSQGIAIALSEPHRGTGWTFFQVEMFTQLMSERGNPPNFWCGSPKGWTWKVLSQVSSPNLRLDHTFSLLKEKTVSKQMFGLFCAKSSFFCSRKQTHQIFSSLPAPIGGWHVLKLLTP